MLKMKQSELQSIQIAEYNYLARNKERKLAKWYYDHLPFGGFINKIA
jgi:hypothetical protein